MARLNNVSFWKRKGDDEERALSIEAIVPAFDF